MSGMLNLMVAIRSPFAATANPDTAFDTRDTTGTAVTNNVTVTARGGTGSYTYAWTRVSGDTSTTCTNPTAATTAWSASVSPLNPDRSSVWRCTVTSGSSTVMVDVNVQLVYDPAGGA